MHVFISWNINFMRFSVADALDYIAYCSFDCNGTSLIAKIYNIVMTNPEKYQNIYFEETNGDMYSFLVYMNKEVSPNKKIGSCSNPRYIYSGGSSSTVWNEKRDDLLSIVNEYFFASNTKRRQDSLKVATENLLNRLVHGKVKKIEFCSVGPLGANTFVHLSSLLGIIPLHCFNCAGVMNNRLGPGSLISRCFNKTDMSVQDVKDEFESILGELKHIWGDLITASLLENTLCEVMRSVRATEKKLKYSKNQDMPVTTIMEDRLRVESEKHDLLFCDQRRQTMQNMFHVSTSGGSATSLRPCLMMRDSLKWSDGSKSFTNLTNWCGSNDRKDNKHLQWSERGKSMTLSSRLEVSSQLRELFKV